MLWLAGFFFLALRFVAKKIGKKKLWFVPFMFLTLGVCALAYAPLPFGIGSIASLVAGMADWVLGWVGGLIGVSSAVIAGLLLVLVLIFGLVDLIQDHKPNGMAKTMVFALPVLALIAAGPIASNVQNGIETVGGWGPNVVSTIAG